MVPKLVGLPLHAAESPEAVEGVAEPEGVVDSTTGVGSSLTLFEPLELDGRATVYGEIDVVLEREESSIPPS